MSGSKKRKPKKASVVIDAGIHSDLKLWCAKRGMKVGVVAGAFIAWALGLEAEKEKETKNA